VIEVECDGKWVNLYELMGIFEFKLSRVQKYAMMEDKIKEYIRINGQTEE
jgi:hypothetical protein